MINFLFSSSWNKFSFEIIRVLWSSGWKVNKENNLNIQFEWNLFFCFVFFFSIKSMKKKFNSKPPNKQESKIIKRKKLMASNKQMDSCCCCCCCYWRHNYHHNGANINNKKWPTKKNLFEFDYLKKTFSSFDSRWICGNSK